MNRSLRRKLGFKKKRVAPWTCPQCGMEYAERYAQSVDLPYIFCSSGCEEFFDLQDNNVTAKLYPNGKPWEVHDDSKS